MKTFKIKNLVDETIMFIEATDISRTEEYERGRKDLAGCSVEEDEIFSSLRESFKGMGLSDEVATLAAVGRVSGRVSTSEGTIKKVGESKVIKLRG